MSEPIISVKRLGHVTLTTPDLQRQIDYYQAIMGFSIVDRTRDRAVLATNLGIETIVLERGATADLAAIAFQIAPGVDLSEVGRELTSRNLPSELRSNITPGVAEAIALKDVYGTPLELYSEYTFANAERHPVGITPIKLGHVARFVTDAHLGERFYRDVLGFRTSDWRASDSVFMRCGPDHHTVNLFKAQEPGFAHIAFEVKDFSDLQRACDVLAGNDLRLDWGPSRHHIGHNISCYHKNWDGLRIEVYTEMDQLKDEALGYFEPRPWHEDMPQRPKVWPANTSRNYWGLWGH